MDAGQGMALGQGRGDGGGRGDRRSRQPVVHAGGRLRPGRADRRPHRLGAERRLAGRRPQRRGRGRGAAPDRRGRHAARHRAARQLGRRGGSAVRPVAVRLERGVRHDGRPGRAPRAPRRRRCAPRGRSGRLRSRPRPRARRTAPARERRRVPRAPHRAGPRARAAWAPARRRPRHVRGGTPPDHLPGQAAHAGSTPMDKRRDALAAAAKLALEIREIAARSDGASARWGAA